MYVPVGIHLGAVLVCQAIEILYFSFETYCYVNRSYLQYHSVYLYV